MDTKPARETGPTVTTDQAKAALPSRPRRRMRIADPGWTRSEATETRARLARFGDDWDAPGMEAYDDL